MIRLIARARRAGIGRSADQGLTMVEVVVAMVVFAIIAVGVAQGIVIASRLSADSQHRAVALNLNASQLDFVRTQTPYNVSSSTPIAPTSTKTIDGITYTTFQTVAWVGTDGADRSCGAVDSSFQLLRVRVQTTWTGQFTGTADATSDALLSSDNTIKDPGNGTIFIKVTKSDGTPYANLQLTAASTGGTALTVPKTNSDGCAFITGVAPGQYVVKASTTGNIDRKQNAVSASAVLSVTAGSAVPVSFDYDVDTSVAVTYTVGGQSNVIYPNDLVTSWYSSSDIPPYYTVNGTPTQVNLFPNAKTGYQGVAGTVIPTSSTTTSCLSPDPGNWDAGPAGGQSMKDGVLQDPVTALPNTSPAYSVPLGVVQAGGGLGSGTYTVTATTAATPGAGDPGCAAKQTYTFTVKNNASPKLALPYGTWTLQYNVLILPVNMTAQALTNDYSTAAGATATLDPRKKN